MGDHLKAHVWKLHDVCVDNEDGESPEMFGSPGLSPVNAFTLQETLFVEQLTSIDERVRLQVFNSQTKQRLISIEFCTPVYIASIGSDGCHTRQIFP